MKINFTHDLALVNGLKIPPKLLGQLNEFKIEKSNHFNLKQSLTKDGYIFVRNLFDKNKIKLARDEVFMRLKEVDEIEDPYQDGIYSGRSSRDKIYTNRGEFWKSVSNGKYLREITNGKVLKKIISDIFGEPSIGFDFLFLRPVANGKFTQMHCDTSFFTRTTKKVLTCWISFTNVTIDKGPLFVIENSHKFNDIKEKFDGFDKKPNLVNDIQAAETFVSNTGAVIKDGGKACYIPSKDYIMMPTKNTFADTEHSTATENYYCTMFHELIHWTGNEKRCNRKLSTTFGSSDYAFVENKSSYLNNLVPINKNFFISNSFKTTHLNYSDESAAITQSDNNFYVFIPELSKIFINDSYDIFKNYLSNLIFLHIDFGEQIILGTNKTEIVNGENLYINIEHPEVYEKMNFDLLIENTKNDVIEKISFNKIQNDINNRRYIDNLSEGEYHISVEGLSDNQLYKSNQIEIIVDPNIIELNKSYRDVSELQIAALKSKGNYFDIESYNKVNSLLNSAISTKKNDIQLNIHSFHKFWFILLITLIIEWFLRKRKGLL